MELFLLYLHFDFSSLVYKIVCKGYKERLFEDLKKLLTDHCQNLKNHLDENVSFLLSHF